MNAYKKAELDSYSMFVQKEGCGKVVKGFNNLFVKGYIDKVKHIKAKETIKKK
jgi:hypothetical protein